MNLTTLTRFKAYAGISGSTQDATITALLPQVSDAIARYLGYPIEDQEFRGWYDGNTAASYGRRGDYYDQWDSPGLMLTDDSCLSTIRLPLQPITAVYHVAVTSRNVANITNSTAARATVSVSTTGVKLVAVTTAGVASVTEKTFAANATLGALETAIETVSGWSMSIVGSTDATLPSILLRPGGGGNATYPAQATVNAAGNSEDVEIIGDDAICAVRMIIPVGRANVFVWGRAGYVLPTDSVDGDLPGGLQLAVNQIMSDIVNSTKLNSSLKSESLGDYSYSLGDVVAAVQGRKQMLERFKRVTL